jgi:hypothetical protein
MPRIIYLLPLCLFTSCLSEKKVTRWLDDNPTDAAGYCATKFPPDTLTKTVVNNIDSAGYFDAYFNMAYLADSLFYRLDSLQNAATPDQPFKINIDSVRKVVDKEIRKRLAPCVDTVFRITYVVRDRAREVELQGKLGEKDNVITVRDERITELESKVKAKNKWIWMFWILVALVGGYTLLKLRSKLPI